MEYPKMLYQAGGSEEIHGGKFDTKIVHDRDEEDAALADGWHLATSEANEAAKAAVVGGGASSAGEKPEADDDAPPTRDELKAKAAELGLKYPGFTTDAKLAELVANALKGEE